MQALAGGQRRRQPGGAHQRQLVRIVGRHRLLEEQQPQVVDRPDLPDRIRRTRVAVVVHHQLRVRRQRVADRQQLPAQDLRRPPVVHGVVTAVPAAAGLDAGEALGNPLPRLLRVARAGIDADRVTHRTAEKLIHRRAQHLALDVPERLIDGAQRGVDHHAAAVAVVQVHDLPEPLDRRRILPHDLAAQQLDRRRDRGGLVDQGRLPPAVHAGVGLHLDEQPVAPCPAAPEGGGELESPRVAAPHDVRRHGGDLHGASSNAGPTA